MQVSRYLPCCALRCSKTLSSTTLYADKKFDGVLFERNSSEKSVLRQMIQQAQAAFVLLLGECLHAIYRAIYPDT